MWSSSLPTSTSRSRSVTCSFVVSGRACCGRHGSLSRQLLEEAQDHGVGRVDQMPSLDRVLAAGGQRGGHRVGDLPEGLRRVGGGNQRRGHIEPAPQRLASSRGFWTRWTSAV